MNHCLQSTLGFALCAAILSQCSSIAVSYDFDKQANFAAYKTYAFTPDAEQLPVDDINRGRILTAVSKALEGKGFTKSDKPDVLIDLNLKTQQKEQATATTSDPYYGVGYGYRWGTGFSTTTINVEDYLEGTLFVDMIDSGKKQLVWQGRAMGTINPNANPQEREKQINDAVNQIFTKYPPR